MKQILAITVLLLAATSAQAQTDPYFQWMNAITDDTLTPRMAAHLTAAGVTGKEQEQAAAILSQFKAAEARLEASDGPNAANNSFYSMQDALVQATIAKLKVLASFQSIDARVQHEAQNIQTAKVHNHPMLVDAAFHPQMPPPMYPSYSLYHTTAMGPALAPLTASMIGQTGGFTQWNPANLVDGNTSDIGFSTDTAQSGQYLGITLSSAQDINGWGLYLSAAQYAGQFEVFYADGGAFTQATGPFTARIAGWNYIWWDGVGAHTQWILALVNTPGAGPTINEMQLIQSGAILYLTSEVSGTTSCPHGCQGAVHHGEATNSLGPTKSGPNVSPTSYIDVTNSQSEWLPVPDPNPPTTVSVGGKVICTLAGIIQNLPITYFDTQRERALTQAYISAIIDNNGMHPEAYYCSDSSAPPPPGPGPDWPGPDQAFPFTPSGQVVNIAFLFREYVHGTSPYGIPWLVYYPKFLPHLGIGYYVNPTMWKPDCTNWDLGFRNLPLPAPLVPQP